MSFVEHLPSAAHDLARHKMRTLLTMLGIIFGDAAEARRGPTAGRKAQAVRPIEAQPHRAGNRRRVTSSVAPPKSQTTPAVAR